MSKPILDQDARLTPEAAVDIVNLASNIACECPRYLVNILHMVREFKAYEADCILRSPKDQILHKWLGKSADNLDLMLSATISQLARMEGMVDEDNVIIPIRKSSL